MSSIGFFAVERRAPGIGFFVVDQRETVIAPGIDLAAVEQRAFEIGFFAVGQRAPGISFFTVEQSATVIAPVVDLAAVEQRASPPSGARPGFWQPCRDARDTT